MTLTAALTPAPGHSHATADEIRILRRFLPHAFDPAASHRGLKQYSDEYLLSYLEDLRRAVAEAVADLRYYGAEETYDESEFLAALSARHRTAGRLAAVVRELRKRPPF